MENFVFQNPTKIIFGKGAEDKIGAEVRDYRRILLVHSGSARLKSSGLYERVLRSLREASAEIFELAGVKPNPLLSLVHEGVRICKEKNIQFVLALGGGSVIDTAKAVAAGACYEGDVWDFFEKNAPTLEGALPVGVILTIAAAGSESSPGSVITKEEGQLKRPFDNDLLYPRFAILNPELTYSLPAYQTACGVADITAHILERYFTRVRQVDLTDRLCEACLKTLANFGPRALAQPEDYEARAELMWVGAIAHNNLLGTGRTGDWASHMIEHEISGIYDVAHGAGLAVVFPAWMAFVYREDPQRFVQFAVRVWDVDASFGNPERIILEGIARQKQFFHQLGLPVSLKEMGIPAGRLEEMAEKSTRGGPLGNFKKLDQADVYSILKLAL